MQSTALYIAGRNINPDILSQLLEWNPLITANASQVDWLSSMDIRLDNVVVTDTENVPGLPYSTGYWMKDRLHDHILEVFSKHKADRFAIVGPPNDKVGDLWEEWLHHRSYPLSIYTGNCKSYCIQKGAVFKKWVKEDFKFQINDKEGSEIDGNFIISGDDFITVNSGWLIVNALSDVIFREFL